VADADAVDMPDHARSSSTRIIRAALVALAICALTIVLMRLLG
jgi:hypothetical protein